MEENGKERIDVCNDLGFSYNTFSDWVNAKKYPRIDKIEMMANYFGISKADLVEEHMDKDEYYIDPQTARIAQASGLLNSQRPLTAPGRLSTRILSSRNCKASRAG